MYRSRSRIPADRRKVELGVLFSAARSNNKGQNITGALLVIEDHFVQVLEGDERADRALFDRIQGDPRRDAVALIETRDDTDRVFARWAMAKVATDGEPGHRSRGRHLPGNKPGRPHRPRTHRWPPCARRRTATRTSGETRQPR